MRRHEATLDIELPLLMEAIYRKYSYDFRNYSLASQKRRVVHALRQMDCSSVSELQARILREPEAFLQLLQYLTIPTTEMFRDPEYFLALREKVVPLLRTYPSLKIWIAGCSTGEELYAMAILLKEEGLLSRSIIYATDINPAVLEKARKGIFPLNRMRAYSANYQAAGGTNSFSDYFTAAYDAAIFDRSLCENVTFADHSLATDSVFSETHFISCRNVMIYFDHELQDRALELFHESLCHRGFLGLGSKENLEFSRWGSRFEAVDKPWRVYRKKG